MRLFKIFMLKCITVSYLHYCINVDFLSILLSIISSIEIVNENARENVDELSFNWQVFLLLIKCRVGIKVKTKAIENFL